MRLGAQTGQPSSTETTQIAQAEQTPLYKRLEKQRKILSRLVGRYAAISGKEHKAIHNEWLRTGGSLQAKASLEELQRKQRWLEDLIDGAES